MSIIHTRVEITNPLGLHLRAARRFAQVAERFQARIIVAMEGKSANGKSILDLITLTAGPGSNLDIGADGLDSEAAVIALSELVESGFEQFDDGSLRG